MLAGACRNEYNEPYRPSISSFCQTPLKEAWLRHLASHFVSQDFNGRQELLEALDKRLQNGTDKAIKPGDNASAVYKLKGYFDDILNPKPANYDGSSLGFRSISKDVLVLRVESKLNEKPKNWSQEIKEVYWNLWPIPQHLKVTNYPLFRGDKIFTEIGHSKNILAHDSPLWLRVQEIFANGFYINKKSDQVYLHQDVFEHTIDSSSSKFIASTKDFEVASEFGLDDSTGWSGVLEFRGEGIDIVATGDYFSALGFLRAMPALSTREKEVAILYGVKAKDIRGLWLTDLKGRSVFIANPNFDETL